MSSPVLIFYVITLPKGVIPNVVESLYIFSSSMVK